MLSEIDIKDWIRTDHPVKLYEVPRNSIVSTEDNPKNPFYFHHIDGAYSLCHSLEDINDIFHLAAWADVFVWEPIKSK